MITPFEAIKTRKFAEEAANQIKQSIFNGTYKSGDKLPSESDLAEVFGVSRVTIRQSVRVLENSGIVYTKQGVDGGIFVAESDPMAVSSYLSDMLKLKRVTQSDLTLSRMIFEPDIASLVTRVWKKSDLIEAEENIRRAETALEKGDLGKARMLNLAFHRLLCDITGNPVIIFTLNSVIDVLEENVLKIKLARKFIHREIEEHKVILDKIKKRKEKEAGTEMRKHIASVHKKLESIHKSKSK